VSVAAISPAVLAEGPYTDAAMPTPTQSRVLWRGRVEGAIHVFEPFLDLLLLVGDHVSRVLEGGDPDYVLARMAPEGDSAPRGLRDRPAARD
jgi:hypothetical protein